ncbi:Sau3AI family type II restriction endonuclease [Leuconostoc citreum]|uniref:Sau3AI family type II restriction endonuclease n=1 Tax=Leuconostoc citreum TaxID=33964 RepID=UPI000BFF093E|nr:Sau3AI family type II restriction endonuclease [Leuconostoc citreum]
MRLTKYKTKESVHNRAVEAVNIPFNKLPIEDMTSALQTLNSRSNKGGVGNFIEQHWFDLTANSSQLPDFEEAHVELKVTPVKKSRKTLVAKERLILGIINYRNDFNLPFEQSHFWNKIRRMELMFYEHNKDVPKEQWKIIKSILYTFPKAERKLIEDDWNTINKFVHEGRAHQISGSSTNVLEAARKGAGGDKDWRPQLIGDEKALQRAFALKNKFMTKIIQDFVLNDFRHEPTVFTTKFEDSGLTSFAEFINSLVQKYIGKSVREIADLLNLQNYDPTSKAARTILIRAMLGITLDTKENQKEFEETNTEIRSITFFDDGSLWESLPLPTFRFESLVKTPFEESSLYQQLEEQRYAFFVFQNPIQTQKITKYAQRHLHHADLIFKGFTLWNFPIELIETTVKRAYERVQTVLQEGVKLEPMLNKDGSAKMQGKTNKIANNLLKESDNIYIHVRPHSQKAAYNYGNPNGNKLPTTAVWSNKNLLRNSESFSDEWMTTQSFWVNKSLIESDIKKANILNN